MKTAFVAVTAVLFPALAFAQPFAASTASKVSFPLLSGTYLIVDSSPCQPALQATTSSGTVTGVALKVQNGAMGSLAVGTIVFSKNKTGSGSFTRTVTEMSGSPFLVKDGSKTTGKPWAMKGTTQTTVFTQTATKFIAGAGAGAPTFFIYYGKSSGGIAQSAVAVTAGSDGVCEDDVSIIRK